MIATISTIFILTCLFALYMLPSIVAFMTGHKHRWIVLPLNIVFGATIFVWLGLLIWSACSEDVY